MTDTEQRAAAKAFAEHWEGRGYEKGESQSFWIELLQTVYGVENATHFIVFEEQVHLDHTSFIDGMIPSTKVMIEQKGIGKDLNKPIKQSDGTLLTPFQQAKRYITELPLSQHPRWVVTCNFEKFQVYDMERPGGEPEEILLENLEKEYYRLQFLVDSGSEHLKREMEVSIAAGEIVGLLYDAFAKQYANPTSERAMKSLNVLCVRFVFCLYAEDAGIFGHHGMFHDYLAEFDARKMRRAVTDLFKILDTEPEMRDPYLKEDFPELAAFPYVNGGLFKDEDIEIPPFTDEIRDLLLNKASEDFDWSEISPTIFGAVFESTLNPETRRSGGMHYTSIENIHKVIDPLFLDGLKAEFASICEIGVERTREKKLREFQKKLASLTFLDPAAGSGNFLTETYLSLRRLENEVLRELSHGQITFGDENYNPIQVSISQFYGIEINDFAVTVAKTALWIAESQMMKETESIVLMHLDFLPLKTNASITEGNALQIAWESVVSKEKLCYIMGNPPFHGFTFMTAEQKEDMQVLFPGVKNLDYVCGWYKKASDYINGTKIEVAFVSTNSIVQGETVARFWDFMLGDVINFAYKTFVWDNEASEKAHVHCVIIGFSKYSRQEKYLYDNGRVTIAQNINYYLLDGDNILVRSRNTPICNVPKMIYGNKPADGGNLIIEDDELAGFLEKDPDARKYIRPLLGASEYIKGTKRWCLWLVGVSPEELKKCPQILERVKKCKEARESSIAAGIRKFAATPTLFAQRTQPTDKDFIIVPRVSSQMRRYVPMGFIKAGTIVTDRVQVIPDASLYDFGVIISNVHMAWMRTTCMRLKSDYSYSKDIVYNNFPWPSPSDAQKEKIKQTAQAILDARALYPDSTLATLYDEVLMPPELRLAHQQNDRAVMQAYGFSVKNMTESTCVAELMRMYQAMTE
ncbi:MAG: methylase [Clostridiales bacterium]|nr:methylase [Clostridiales bacterium]